MRFVQQRVFILDVPDSGVYTHMSNHREFDCSRVGQFEKPYEKASLKPQFTATKYR